MRLEFSKQIFEKYTNNKLHQNPSSGNRAVACGRTDRHDERIYNAVLRILHYYNRTECYSQWMLLLYRIPDGISKIGDELKTRTEIRYEAPLIQSQERLSNLTWTNNKYLQSVSKYSTLHTQFLLQIQYSIFILNLQTKIKENILKYLFVPRRKHPSSVI
jgi:hypothetical protein